ncbi:hypothetical protein WNZ15_18485 [Roseibium sp. AS2]|uniref:hypothetical protein n=1 Tax=Roseibium sp. AS2 TaxID=3135781 RepID=UPI003174D449
MSVSSLLNSANFQKFPFRSGQENFSLSNKLSTAVTLITTIGSDTEDAAQSLFDSYKESVELTSSLARSVENNQDSMRSQKISQIKQRIEQLKEMLRFASPEQAERLLKELKQISKEFKSAAQGLAKAGSALAAGSSVSTIAASATGHVDTATASAGAVVNPAAAVAETTAATASTGAPVTTTGPLPANTPSEEEGGAAQTSSETIPGEQDAQDENAGWQADLTAAIQTYADRQEEADKAHQSGQVETLKAQREELRKIARDIKMLADQLERLAEDDDEDAHKALKDVRGNMTAGDRALNDPELERALETGTPMSEPASPAAYSGPGIGIDVSTGGITTVLSEVIV